MSLVFALDAGPRGLVTNPQRSPESMACPQWLQALGATGSRVALAKIADYEVRRELLRGRRQQGLRRLDALVETVEYLPLTTAAMRQVAAVWAEARQPGRPTPEGKALDGDVILAAQVATMETAHGIVATTNVGYRSRYVQAAVWRDIPGAQDG